MSVLEKKRIRSVMKNTIYEYDVALSFAGENRAYVEAVAKSLRAKGVSVFYDLFEEANLWGKNLYEYLSDIYQNKAKYTVIFISHFYNKKLWTNHERSSMQARAFQESKEYILPARFDDTEIPGILNTIGYISLKGKSPEAFADLIVRKLHPNRNDIKKKWSRSTTMINPKPHIFTVKIVNQADEVVNNAKIVLIAKNSTYLESNSDENGLAHFVIRVRKNYTLLIAHPNYPAVVFNNINPNEDIKVSIENSQDFGSAIINKSSSLPGLTGNIQPTFSVEKGFGLYADNVAIEGGVVQPYRFDLNTSIILEDNGGNVLNLIFRFYSG